MQFQLLVCYDGIVELYVSSVDSKPYEMEKIPTIVCLALCMRISACYTTTCFRNGPQFDDFVLYTSFLDVPDMTTPTKQ